ncbi:MAG TPA: chemotaxis protein CheW [Polyangia bacterium]|jgi:chemotaxis signal transduction protein|nr:chemotaxis protein CheW [Polyangia bacterium]
MNDDQARGSVSAEALRRAFDHGFAAPARVHSEDAVDLLALTVGTERYAVRLGDVGGLLVDRRLVALPATVPEFLGLTAIKGGVVPVWSLSALLGYGADHAPPRWLILVGGRSRGETLAVAFERFDGHLRVPRGQLSERSSEGSSEAGHRGAVRVRHSVRADGGPLGVLDVAAIIDDIKRRLGLPAGKDDETADAAR